VFGPGQGGEPRELALDTGTYARSGPSRSKLTRWMADGTQAKGGGDDGGVGAPASPVELRIRALLAEGDTRAAATDAIRAYGPELLRFLRGLLGNETEAQEAFALAGERIWRGLAGFRGEASLRTWALRVAWSAAQDRRKEAWGRRGRRLETEEAEALHVGEETSSWLRHERLRLSLETIRATLSLDEQSLLQLRIDRGLSWAECATVLAADGEPVRTDALMKRFERLKEKLRDAARREAGAGG